MVAGGTIGSTAISFVVPKNFVDLTTSQTVTGTKTFTTPVLGVATATSINGIAISAGGSGALTMAGSINTGSSGGSISTHSTGGSINTSQSGGYIYTSNSGGSIDTSNSGGYIRTYGGTLPESGYVNPGGYIDTTGNSTDDGVSFITYGSGGNIKTFGNVGGSGGEINTSSGTGTGCYGGSINTSGGGAGAGGDINTSNGGGDINTTQGGSLTTGSGNLTGPNTSGTLVLEDNTATITNKSIAATQLTGTIAAARITGSLTIPGAIGGTTPSTGAFTTVSLKGATSGVVTLAAPATATTATLTFAPSASVTMTPPATNFTAARTDAAQTFTDVTDRNGTTAGSLILSGPGPALRLATTSGTGFFTVYTHPSNNNSYVGCPGSIVFTNSYNGAGTTTFSISSAGDASATSVTLPVTNSGSSLNLGNSRGIRGSTNYVEIMDGSTYMIALNSGGSVLNCNLDPSVTNQRRLGTSGSRWSSVSSVLGDFSGAVTAASVATTGNAGLSGTWSAVPTSLPTYANDEYFRILLTPPTTNAFGTNARVMDIVAGSGNVGSFMRFMLGPASTAATTKMVLSNTGGLQIGGGDAIPNANAILDLQGTTKAFMPPRVTTTQKGNIASPTAGMVVYDSTLNKLAIYTGSAWETGVLEAGVKQTVSVIGTNLVYYGTGNRSTTGAILGTQPSADCASGSIHRLVFTVCPNYWAGKSVKIKMIFTNPTTGNQQEPRLGCAIRNTTLDGVDVDQYNLGSSDSNVFNQTYAATGPTVASALVVAESAAFTIPSSATAITIQVGFEVVSAGTAQIAEAQLIEQ